jgi:hypothetical protein
MKTLLLILLSLTILASCSKSSKSSRTSATGIVNQSGYATCPASGYLVYQGASYQCTPGTQFYVGNTTNGQTICPQNGYYTSGGMTYSCTPGQQIYSGGTNPGGGQQQGYCTQYTQQYGVPYVLVNYQGQYVCMRYDLSGGYQIIGY